MSYEYEFVSFGDPFDVNAELMELFLIQTYRFEDPRCPKRKFKDLRIQNVPKYDSML